jgi:MFS family permease
MSAHAFLSGSLALRVLLCFAGAYLLSYAFRAINAVIAPALQADLNLSNADLGLLSSAYFVSFACLQLPLGIWLDRYGARRTESALLLLAAAGAAIFAMGTSLTELWIGRALIGAGVSACLMAPFKAFRQWYAPQRQSQLASWMLVAGTAGALAATVPVAAAMTVVGWRGVFWIMAAMILLSAASIYFLIGAVETKAAAAMQLTASAPPLAKGDPRPGGYGEIFGSPYFRRLALIGAVNQGSFIALQTLWAGPWMMTVLGMTKSQTSEILFVFNFCMMLGYLGLSWWAPRHISHDGKHGWPVLQVVGFGMFGSIATQLAILTITSPWAWLLWIALALFGTGMMLCQTQISLAFPVSQSGRASSAYNLMVFIGAFVVQWGIGLLIDVFEAHGTAPAAAIRGGFGVCLALQTASFIAFALNRAQLQRSAATL